MTAITGHVTLKVDESCMTVYADSILMFIMIVHIWYGSFGTLQKSRFAPFCRHLAWQARLPIGPNNFPRILTVRYYAANLASKLHAACSRNQGFHSRPLLDMMSIRAQVKVYNLMFIYTAHTHIFLINYIILYLHTHTHTPHSSIIYNIIYIHI